MKAAVLLLLVGSALAAPTEEVQANTDIIESARSKKSAYGPAPCSGGAPLAPVALYLSAQPSGMGSQQQYRENEHKEDTKEMARSYYNSPGAGAAYAASGAGAGAVGLFPNANVGGCAIPLLLSCAPNVVSGQLAHAPAQPAQYSAYRASEIDSHKQLMAGDFMKGKSSEAQQAASEKESTMEDPELEKQTLFHHHRPMGMGFMNMHQQGMMGFPQQFGHGMF